MKEVLFAVTKVVSILGAAVEGFAVLDISDDVDFVFDIIDVTCIVEIFDFIVVVVGVVVLTVVVAGVVVVVPTI